VDLAREPRRFYELALRLRELHDQDQAAFNAAIRDRSIRRRRAYELLRIANAFADAGLAVERLEAIGWTKLALVAKRLSDLESKGEGGMQIESYIDLAERHTVHELPARLAMMVEPLNTRLVSLWLTPEEYEVYRVSMIAHGATAHGKGLSGQEAALMKLLSEASSKT